MHRLCVSLGRPVSFGALRVRKLEQVADRYAFFIAPPWACPECKVNGVLPPNKPNKGIHSTISMLSAPTQHTGFLNCGLTGRGACHPPSEVAHGNIRHMYIRSGQVLLILHGYVYLLEDRGGRSRLYIISRTLTKASNAIAPWSSWVPCALELELPSRWSVRGGPPLRPLLAALPRPPPRLPRLFPRPRPRPPRFPRPLPLPRPSLELQQSEAPVRAPSRRGCKQKKGVRSRPRVSLHIYCMVLAASETGVTGHNQRATSLHLVALRTAQRPERLP